MVVFICATILMVATPAAVFLDTICMVHTIVLVCQSGSHSIRKELFLLFIA